MERSVPMANTIEEASSDNEVVMVEPTKKPQMQINPIFINIVTDGSTQSNVDIQKKKKKV
jgi:hypothetical protein